MNEARQQMIERIAEDESLVGELAGDAADCLRQWANDTAYAVARRTDLDDATVQAYVRAVRAAARVAAAHDGDLMVAQQTLDQHALLPTIPTVVEVPSPPSAVPPISVTVVDVPAAALPQPIMLRIRGWWRGIWSHTTKDE